MSKVLWLLVLLGSAHAQAAAGVLVEMASQAGVIFSGEVISVARHDEQGFVEVRFHVDAAVRGCTQGGTYTLREWAGRWVGQGARYTAGQQLLMLLTAPGPAGLSAPVYGTDGALAIVAGAAGTAVAAADKVVDLRLLAARAVPAAAGDTHNDLLVIGPIAIDGTAAVWPALADVLALLRGGAGAWR